MPWWWWQARHPHQSHLPAGAGADISSWHSADCPSWPVCPQIPPAWYLGLSFSFKRKKKIALILGHPPHHQPRQPNHPFLREGSWLTLPPSPQLSTSSFPMPPFRSRPSPPDALCTACPAGSLHGVGLGLCPGCPPSPPGPPCTGPRKQPALLLPMWDSRKVSEGTVEQNPLFLCSPLCLPPFLPACLSPSFFQCFIMKNVQLLQERV